MQAYTLYANFILYIIYAISKTKLTYTNNLALTVN